jgi:hypothetical protein
VFDKLTPGWGWIAPVGVEFGLLYAAFRRRHARHTGEDIRWTLWALEILLFLTAILVNGAGAFASVVSATQLTSLSFAAIADGFGNLPATSRAALIMAGLAAFIIPIGALGAGEGLAALALERRTRNDLREKRWHEVEFTTTYRAVFVRYLQGGLPDQEAKQRALSAVKGYLSNSLPFASSRVRMLSAGSGQSGQETDGQARYGTVSKDVKKYLAEHPELTKQSVNLVWTGLRLSGLRVGRTTVADVLKEMKAEQ